MTDTGRTRLCQEVLYIMSIFFISDRVDENSANIAFPRCILWTWCTSCTKHKCVSYQLQNSICFLNLKMRGSSMIVSECMAKPQGLPACSLGSWMIESSHNWALVELEPRESVQPAGLRGAFTSALYVTDSISLLFTSPLETSFSYVDDYI